MYLETYLANSHGMQVLQPAITCLRNFEIEKPRVDQLFDIHFAVLGLQDLGAMVQLLDKVKDFGLDFIINLASR
jgi:hypothetical protein